MVAITTRKNWRFTYLLTRW